MVHWKSQSTKCIIKVSKYVTGPNWQWTRIDWFLPRGPCRYGSHQRVCMHKAPTGGGHPAAPIHVAPTEGAFQQDGDHTTQPILFFFFLAAPRSLWDLSSPTRALAVKAPSPNHWTARECPFFSPTNPFLIHHGSLRGPDLCVPLPASPATYPRVTGSEKRIRMPA